MKIQRILLTVIAALMVIALTGLLLPVLTKSASNCGGNSYALAACKDYVMRASLASGKGGREFSIASLGIADREEVARWAKNHWIGGADFLILTNEVSMRGTQSVLIVCDQPFGNIPQPTVWNLYHKNPAHAVGYSDGSTGLISPLEFAALDLHGFVPLSGLATTGTVQATRP